MLNTCFFDKNIRTKKRSGEEDEESEVCEVFMISSASPIDLKEA